MSKSATALEQATPSYAQEYDRHKPWQVTVKTGTGT
jgi:hypothetical protein